MGEAPARGLGAVLRRQAPGVPLLAAAHGSRDVSQVVWVFCEGKNTETGWLEHLRQRRRGVGVRIEDSGGLGTAITVAELAAEKRARLARSKDTRGDEVWAVFDRDEHHRVREAIELCRDAEVGVAFSNASFELWPLLHFQELHANLHCKDLQRRLHEAHPAYLHDRGARVTWERIEANVGEATRRAVKQLVRRFEGEGPFDGLPSTTAWLLHLRLLGAADRNADWFVSLCKEHPALDGAVDHFAEPLRERIRRAL